MRKKKLKITTNVFGKIRLIVLTKRNNLLMLILVMTVISLIAISGSQKTVFQQTPSAPLNIPEPTAAPHKTYISNNLGVSFSYLTQVAGRQNFSTKEIGNTIYLYISPNYDQTFNGTDSEFLNTLATGGFTLTVFNKERNQSLINVIKEQFLVGYSTTDCIVKATGYGHPREDESIQTAVIQPNFVPNRNRTRAELDEIIAKCPKQYTSAFGVNYFMMDPKHPNKFLFINLGQYNIPSGINGYTWDATIKIF